MTKRAPGARVPRGMFLVATVLAGLVVAPVGSVRADVFTSARWYFGPDAEYVTGTGIASIPPRGFDLGNYTGTASAGAHADYLVLGSAAAFSTLNASPTIYTEALARAIAETRDVLTPHGLPAGTAGFLVYKLRVSGTNAATLGATHAGDSIGATAIEVFTWIVGYRGPANDTTPLNGLGPLHDWVVFLPDLTSASVEDVPVEAVFPITYETPASFYLIMTSLARIIFHPAADAVTFEGVSDFSGTLIVEAIELRDADHQPVPGASLTSASGTAYPGAGGATTSTVVSTTLPLPPTTTTVPPAADACDAEVGLARPRCRLAAALAQPLCADPEPSKTMRVVAGRLAAVDRLLDRAIGATGGKQAKLVKRARRALAAASSRASAAIDAKRAKKRISAACGAAIAAVVSAVESELP